MTSFVNPDDFQRGELIGFDGMGRGMVKYPGKDQLVPHRIFVQRGHIRAVPESIDMRPDQVGAQPRAAAMPAAERWRLTDQG